MTNSIEPLYVDARASERGVAILDWLINDFHADFPFRPIVLGVLKQAKELPYEGNGTLLSPFVTLDEARKVQKPGQPIIVAGYGTLNTAPPSV